MSDDEHEGDVPADNAEPEDEEVPYEPIDTASLPDGSRTVFVGGFSILKTIEEGINHVVHPEDSVIVLPGKYTELVQLTRNVRIRGMPTVGSPTDTDDSGSVIITKGMVSSRTASGSTVERVTVKNGLEVQQQSHVTFLECQFLGGASDSVVVVSANADPIFRDCRVVSDVRVGVYVMPFAKGRWEGCTIEGKTSPSSSGPSTSAVIIHDGCAEFTKCNIRGGTTAVYCSGQQNPLTPTDASSEGADISPASSVRSTFIGCDIHHASNTGIHFDGTSASRAIECTVFDCGHYSLLFTGTTKGIFRSGAIVGPAGVRVKATAHPGLCDNIAVGSVCPIIFDNVALAQQGFVPKAALPPKPAVKKQVAAE